MHLFNNFLSYDLISCMYFCYSFLLTIFGIYVNYNFSLNKFVIDLYKYGKLSNKRTSTSQVPKFIEVPKRWFLHFYYTSLLMSVVSLVLIFHVTFKGNAVPQYVVYLFNWLTTSQREVVVNAEICYLVLLLYSIHVWKRLMESLFVSVLSDTKMNVTHYLIGHTHYIGAFVGLIAQFPGFQSPGSLYKRNESFQFSWWHYIIILFIVSASYMQHHSLIILANLRKKKNSNKSKEIYFVPTGGLFSFVSCPHFFTEILVYFGIGALMSFKHSTWNAVCLFVLCNQIQVGLMNHKWYKKQYKDYPLNRKAIFPYLL